MFNQDGTIGPSSKAQMSQLVVVKGETFGCGKAFTRNDNLFELEEPHSVFFFF